MVVTRTAALYIPIHTARPAVDRIVTAGLGYCEHHALTLTSLAWRPASAAGLVVAGVAGIIIATRHHPDLDRAVRRASGRLVVLRATARCRGSAVAETVAALVAAGRLDPAVAAELLAADAGAGPAVRPPDLDRRPQRTSRRP